MQESNGSPIFIHSLFRAGSTYLFHVFRRSENGYWCYQEAMHEYVDQSRDNPELLLDGLDHEAMRLYRHPRMDKSYFDELYQTWQHWKDQFNVSAVFNAYFAPPNTDIGISFWQALINAAHGRPVFQECRTSGKIRAIKQQLGGYHIYLWRNPWDQWWSYKVTPYFDTANQLIIHAKHSPVVVQLLLASLKLEAYEQDDIKNALAYYSARPLSSEESYLVFYTLWCLGLREGINHAHLLINIDYLSEYPSYRDEVLNQLQSEGIRGITFSDCHIPQGRYLEQDRDFFAAQEAKVHQWLQEGGWDEENLKLIHSVRQKFQPWNNADKTGYLPEVHYEQESRARALVRRFETKLAHISREHLIKLAAIETRAQQQVQQAQARTQQAQQQVQQAQARTQQAQQQVQQAEARTQQAQQQVQQAQARTQQAQQQVQQAEARTQQAQQQVQQAEARTQQAQQQVQQAEARTAEREAALQATRKELYKVHQANHRHHQLAETRQQQIQAMLNSASWRVTAPLRWIGAVAQPYYLKARFEKFFKRTARFVNKNPRIKKLALIALNRFPRIKSRLSQVVVKKTGVAIKKGQTQNVPSVSPNLSQLTPRARQIYANLKAAIERNIKEVN